MSRMRTLFVLLGCAVMAPSGTLHAQARSSAPRELRSVDKKVEKQPATLDATASARRMAEPDAWLRRLVGHFRIDGKLDTPRGIRKVVGTADCIGIGSGPGVHCMLHAKWKTIQSNNPLENLEPYNNLQPLVILFGIDPNALVIQQVFVTDHVEGRTGVFKDEAVVFPTDPWKGCRLWVTACWGANGVIAKPGSDLIMRVRFGIPLPDFIELRLIRERPGDPQSLRNLP